MGKVVILKDEDGNPIYPVIFEGIREPIKKFDCCLASHRGFCSEYPENTMPAFIGAVERGYRFIEADVVQSKDGVQFILHDATIDRTSNGTGTASQLTAEQLLSYDYGYSQIFGDKFQGTKIPTLEELLIFCKRNHCIVELDLADATRYNAGYLRNTYDLVKRTGMLDSTFFCGTTNLLQSLMAIDNSVMVSVSGMTSISAMDAAYEIVKTSRWITFSCTFTNVTKELIYHAHELGVAFKTWHLQSYGTDTYANADIMFDKGVDYILSDIVTPRDFRWLK